VRRAAVKRGVVVLTCEWGITQFARLAALFTICRIIYGGGLVHVCVVRIVIVEILRLINGFRKITGSSGPNSRW
jgi:hypothetical protein